ncbi:unnamed protein product [Leuciscus chuanchicus]
MAHGRRSDELAWPSGLRRWIKAPVSSGAWVRIPSLPRQPFRRHLSAFAFLGRTQWDSEPDDEGPHATAFSIPKKKWPENGPRKMPRRGSVAEGSKALDLGSSLFGGVGSNPTAASSGFKEGPTP